MTHIRFSYYPVLLFLFLGVVIAINYRAFDAPLYYDSVFFLDIQGHRYLAGDFWGVLRLFPQRPVTMASFYLSYLLGGLTPYYFRIFNALLMAMTGLVVALTIRLIFETPALKNAVNEKEKSILAISLGLIFVIHPVQLFVVNYIWQRGVLLCCFFYYSALAVYLAARTSHLSARLGYSLGLGLFLLALTSKENAITLPVIVLLSEIAFFRTGVKGLLKICAVIVGLGALVLAMMSSMERPHGSETLSSGIMTTVWQYYSESGLTLTEVLVNQCRVLFDYIALIVDPEQFRLQIITPRVLAQSIGQSMEAAGAVLAAILFVIIGIVLLRSRPLSGFGILFFVIGLIPESVLVPQYLFIIYRASLPMLGLLMVLADILCLILQQARNSRMAAILRVAVVAVLLVVAVVLSYATRCKAEDWRDPVVFWKKVVEQLPPLDAHIEREGIRQALNHLGFSLVSAGRSVEALEHHRKAVAVNPRADTTYALMANAHIGMGDFDQAEAAYRKALQLNPTNTEALAALAGVVSRNGRNDEAVEHYRKAVEIMPTIPTYHYSLGVVLIRMGKHTDAINSLRTAIQLNPAYADAHYKLGKALLEVGKSREASVEFYRTVGLKPDHAEAHTDLGVMLATAGRIQEAATHFQEALKKNPGDEIARENLETALKQMREN